jgi:hypothetical protein
VVDSFHIHSSSPLAMFDQVQGAGYFESEVETNDATALELEMDTTPLKLETDATPLELEMETNVSQETSMQERYSAD